jgi:hypothetical protein
MNKEVSTVKEFIGLFGHEREAISLIMKYQRWNQGGKSEIGSVGKEGTTPEVEAIDRKDEPLPMKTLPWEIFEPALPFFELAQTYVWRKEIEDNLSETIRKLETKADREKEVGGILRKFKGTLPYFSIEDMLLYNGLRIPSQAEPIEWGMLQVCEFTSKGGIKHCGISADRYLNGCAVWLQWFFGKLRKVCKAFDIDIDEVLGKERQEWYTGEEGRLLRGKLAKEQLDNISLFTVERGLLPLCGKEWLFRCFALPTAEEKIPEGWALPGIDIFAELPYETMLWFGYGKALSWVHWRDSEAAVMPQEVGKKIKEVVLAQMDTSTSMNNPEYMEQYPYNLADPLEHYYRNGYKGIPAYWDGEPDCDDREKERPPVVKNTVDLTMLFCELPSVARLLRYGNDMMQDARLPAYKQLVEKKQKMFFNGVLTYTARLLYLANADIRWDDIRQSVKSGITRTLGDFNWWGLLCEWEGILPFLYEQKDTGKRMPSGGEFVTVGGESEWVSPGDYEVCRNYAAELRSFSEEEDPILDHYLYQCRQWVGTFAGILREECEAAGIDFTEIQEEAGVWFGGSKALSEERQRDSEAPVPIEEEKEREAITPTDMETVLSLCGEGVTEEDVRKLLRGDHRPKPLKRKKRVTRLVILKTMSPIIKSRKYQAYNSCLSNGRWEDKCFADFLAMAFGGSVGTYQNYLSELSIRKSRGK